MHIYTKQLENVLLGLDRDRLGGLELVVAVHAARHRRAPDVAHL